MKSYKRFAVMMLVVVTIVSTMAMNASASVWRTGDFVNPGSWTSGHSITLSNQSKPGYVKIHAYTCTRGRGHSGACKNSRDVSGSVAIQVAWASPTSKSPVQSSRNYYKLPAAKYPYYIWFAGTNYAHWAIEGTSNIRSIS